MKKLLSITLSLILFVSALPAFAAKESTIGEYDYFLEAQELLTGLGCQNVSSKKATPISREAWLNLATEFSYYDNVTRQNLAGAGIHSETNYYFYPEENIKVRDAVVMLVKLLGYMPGVEYEASVYINVAAKLDIDNGINASFNDDLTYENAYILLYNYLRANTAELKISSGGVNIKSGDTNILYEKYGITLVEGQVTETPSYSLKGEPALETGFLKIGDDLCKNNRYNADEFFGCSVIAYVRDYKGTNEIVSMQVSSDCEITVITSENTPEYRDGAVYYSPDGAKEKKINVSPLADMFRNGESYVFDENTFVPCEGKMTFVDNGKGEEIIIIESTSDIKVSATDSRNLKIYSKDCGGLTYTIDDETALITPDGVKMDFESITVGDVITIWEKSDGSLHKAVVCTNALNLEAEEVSGASLIFDGTKYDFSPSRYDYFKDILSPGKTYDAIINIYGKIADLKETAAADGLVGIMVQCAVKTSGLSQSMSVKIYDMTDGFVTYPVSKKNIVNGKAFKTYDEIFGAIPKKEGTDKVNQTLILYKLNDAKEVISVDIASEVPMDITGDSKLYVTKYTEESNNATGKYKRYSKFLGPDLMIEPTTTTMFRFPIQSEDGSVIDEEEMYSAKKLISVTSGTIYSNCRIIGYSLDPEDKIAKYVTVEYDGSSGDIEGVSGDVRLSMVGEIKQCIHNDEPVEAVTIYNKHNVNGITVYGKSLTHFTDLGFEAGDLVRVSYNSETLVAKAAEIIWKRGSETLANNKLIFGGEAAICDVRFLKTYKRWGVTVDMFYKDVDMSTVTTDDAMVFRADLYVLFRYNEKLGTVENLTYNDFLTYDTSGNSASEIILETRYRDPMSMFFVD